MTDQSTDTTSPFPALISGLLMLYVGFGLPWSVPVEASVYQYSVIIFIWAMRIGGAAMMLVALLCLARISIAMTIETLTSGICGLVMVIAGPIWIINGYMTGLLLLIFAMMFLHSAWENWPVLRSPRADVEAMLDADVAAGHRREAADNDDDYEPRTPTLPRRTDLQKRTSPPITKEPPDKASPPAPSPPPPAKSTPSPPPAEEDEPAEGFLADLGRSDDEKEKGPH